MIEYFYKCSGSPEWNKVQEGSHNSTLQPGAKLPWTIVVNDTGVLNWESDTEWVITDTIPKGLVLDENSIKIGCGSWYTASPSSYTATVTKLADGSTKLVITMQPDAFSYTDNDGEK